ncbi:hypothetical protein Tco_1246202 [Tanacetum coccineum]
MPGRPRKKRIRAIGEGGSSTRVSKAGSQGNFSNCRKHGYNKASCKEPVVEQTLKPKGVQGRPRKKQSVDNLEDVDIDGAVGLSGESSGFGGGASVSRGVASGSRGGTSGSGGASGSRGRDAGRSGGASGSRAVEEEQNQPEVMQELLLKLMKDLQILNGIQPKQEKQAEQDEPATQSFLLNLNFPMADDDEYTVIYRKPKAITPDLPTEEPDNSLNISITSPKIDFLPEEFAGELDLIDPILPGIDEDDSDEDDFDEEEGDIDIFQIEDEILREKLLNVNLLVDKIEALKLTPSIPFVLEYPSSSPIPVVDSDFLIEEVDTFLVSEDSIPPGIESDLGSEEDIIFLDNLLNDDPIPEYERFTFDIEPDAPVINNFDELNEDECFDPGGGEIDVSQNIEDDDSFAFVIRTFLPYRTYPVDSPLLLSTGSEDTIFDPGIST